VDETIAAIAALQHGLITFLQLLAAGLTDRSLDPRDLTTHSGSADTRSGAEDAFLALLADEPLVNVLKAAGYETFRFTDEDVYQRPQHILRTLSARRPTPSSSCATRRV
jgi:hypothetical protein